MNRKSALEYLNEVKSTVVKVADRYDDDAQLREALSALMPDYEYPDISYLTLAQLHRRCRRMLDPDVVALKEASLRKVADAANAQASGVDASR